MSYFIIMKRKEQGMNIPYDAPIRLMVMGSNPGITVSGVDG
jgi:hypothetical protein